MSGPHLMRSCREVSGPCSVLTVVVVAAVGGPAGGRRADVDTGDVTGVPAHGSVLTVAERERGERERMRKREKETKCQKRAMETFK